MKTKTFLLAILATTALASAAHADLNILWNVDNSSGFDLTVSGTGGFDVNPASAGFHTTSLISPSGLWEYMGGSGAYVDTFNNVFKIGGGGNVNFLGPTLVPVYDEISPSLQADGYSDPFPLSSTTLHGEQIFLDGMLRPDWSGSTTIDVTSIPDVNDASTWVWSAHFYASGPAPTPAPEPATIYLGIAGGLMAFALRKCRQ